MTYWIQNEQTKELTKVTLAKQKKIAKQCNEDGIFFYFTSRPSYRLMTIDYHHK